MLSTANVTDCSEATDCAAAGTAINGAAAVGPKGARSIDAQLDDMQVVIFGNPMIGTPIIAAEPTAGLDLPLRVLIYDDSGQTRIASENPSALRDRRNVQRADEAFAAMTSALESLTVHAASEWSISVRPSPRSSGNRHSFACGHIV